VPDNTFLHIGRFRAHVKSESVCVFVANKVGVDIASIICKPFVKNRVNVSKLQFLNFKLGIHKQHLNTVYSDEFWPNPIKTSRRFIHRDRPIVDDKFLDLENQQTSVSKNTQ